jgi:hypothetical protein
MPAAAPGIPSYASVIQSLMSTPAPPSVMQGYEGMFGNDKAVQAFGQMTDQANKANFTRGQNILGLLAGAGEAAKQDNQDIFKQEKADIEQMGVTRGLSNTTVIPNLITGATSQLMRENGRIDEQSAGQLGNVLNSFTQQAPNPQMLASLVEQKNAAPKTPLPRSVNIPMGYGGSYAAAIDQNGDYTDPFTLQHLHYG